MSNHRIDMINEELRREISTIMRELKDPRIDKLTSVVKVNATNDLKYAKVYVSLLNDDEAIKKETIKGLTSSSGYIRRELKNRLTIRYVPELAFTLDDSIRHGAHINDIISKLDIKKSEEDF